MNKKIKTLFAVVIVVGIVFQFIIPATMILRQEEILRKGVRVYFETGVVDPLDVFCGRYVDLRLAEFSGNRNRQWFALTNHPSVVLYAVLNTNEHGVAKVTMVTPEKPEGENVLFFIVKREHTYSQYLGYPFKNFYMPEKLAPVAEEIYWEMAPQRGQETTNSVLLAVRIHNGKTAVEDLLVNGTPMIHAAQERLKQGKQK